MLVATKPTLFSYDENQKKGFFLFAFSECLYPSIRDLFASSIVSVAFSFRSVLPFSGSQSMMPFALFYSHKHPLLFVINTSTKQGSNGHNLHRSRRINLSSSLRWRHLLFFLFVWKASLKYLNALQCITFSLLKV